MTENEAIKGLEILKYQCKHNGECGTCNICCSAIPLAIQTLEEIPRYRDLGTVDELAEMQVQYHHLSHQIKKYESIGTVEDFRNAVEIIRPRKPYKGSFGTILCSLCGEKVGQAVTKTNKADCMNFCANCGSMIDWIE